MSDSNLPPETSSFFLYSGKNGKVPIECRVLGETIWLTQKQLSELFDVGVPAINKHLKNIFETGELIEEATVSKMEIVRKEGSGRLSDKSYRTISMPLSRSAIGSTATKRPNFASGLPASSKNF